MKIVYQADRDGWYLGPVEADESPLEPGVYLIPAMAFEDAPPPAEEWGENARPRRTTGCWAMQVPRVAAAPTAAEKLAAFLANHPDVAELVNAAR